MSIDCAVYCYRWLAYFFVMQCSTSSKQLEVSYPFTEKTRGAHTFGENMKGYETDFKYQWPFNEYEKQTICNGGNADGMCINVISLVFGKKIDRLPVIMANWIEVYNFVACVVDKVAIPASRSDIRRKSKHKPVQCVRAHTSKRLYLYVFSDCRRYNTSDFTWCGTLLLC